MPVALPDIDVLTQTISVGTTDLTVQGVSARGIISLITRFPEVRTALAGNSGALEKLRDDIMRIAAMAPEAIAAIIAAGLGRAADAEAEAWADALPVEVQLDLLGAVIKCTMPHGVGPFVVKFQRLAAGFGAAPPPAAAAPSTKAPGTKSRKA